MAKNNRQPGIVTPPVVPTPDTTAMTINPMDIYNIPRKHGDIDLISILAENITALGGVLMLPNFHIEMQTQGIAGVNPVVQRILLNRYLTHKLLVYRSVSGVNVTEILPFMASDGYVEDWLSLMKEIVLPFVVANSVLVVLEPVVAPVNTAV